MIEQIIQLFKDWFNEPTLIVSLSLILITNLII